MSKILKALEHAEADAREGHDRNPAASEEAGAHPSGASGPDGFSQVNLEEEMIALHQRLDALLPEGPCRALEFIGSRDGEGTSTVIAEFARVSAARFGQRVLLLQLDRPGRAGRVGGGGPDRSVADAAPVPAGSGTLDIAPLPPACLAVAHTGDSPEPAATWARLRSAYDLILVDAPPASTSPQGLGVSRQVDGVVLVIAAEDTRWPVAERVRQSIERSGGRVLGVVLNKRRYHIPRWIYQRL